MIMDPPRIASLLSSLKDYTKDTCTLALVRDGLPSAVVLGVGSEGGIRFLSVADNFTRAIAEAHDRGRKIAGLTEAGAPHDDQVTAKPDQAQQTTLLDKDSSSEPRAAVDILSPAARIVSTLAALRVYVGANIPAIATQLMKEIEEIAGEIEVVNSVNGIVFTGVSSWMAAVAAMPDIVAKTADARAALESDDIAKAKDYLTGVENAIAVMESAIYP